MLAFVKTPHVEKSMPRRARRSPELTGALAPGRGDRAFSSAPMPGAGTRPSWKPRWRRISSAEWQQGRKQLSDQLRSCSSAGAKTRAVDYQRGAAQDPGRWWRASTSFFMERYDPFLRRRAGHCAKGLAATRRSVFLHALDAVRNAGAIAAAMQGPTGCRSACSSWDGAVLTRGCCAPPLAGRATR